MTLVLGLIVGPIGLAVAGLFWVGLRHLEVDDRVASWVALALIVFAFVHAGRAEAYGSVTPQQGLEWRYMVEGLGDSAWMYPTGSAACTGAAGLANRTYPHRTYTASWRQDAPDSGGCTLCESGACGTGVSVTSRLAIVCPSGSTRMDNGSCGCDLGMKPEAGQCVPYQCPAKGSYQPITQPDVKMNQAGENFCDGGCSFTPSSWKMDQQGQFWGTWPFKSTGQTCGGKAAADGTKTGTDDLPKAPTQCGPNQCPGSVNGANVCVPCKSQQAPGPSSASSGVQPSDPGNGIKGSESSTTCDGANCTTETKYRDGQGNEVGSKSDIEPQEAYCQKNPTAQQCKKNAFGGSCGGGFTCDGDAIQCALSREVHVRNCQWYEDKPSDAQVNAGEAAMAGGDRPSFHPGNEPNVVNMTLAGQLDFTDRLGSGCPSDVSVGSVTLPFSRLCPHLETLGRIAVGFCTLMAVFIVFRS